MPYSGAGDPKLPSNVRVLSKKRRKQWTDIWNSCKDAGNAESQCFAMANGVIKRGLSKKERGTFGDPAAALMRLVSVRARKKNDDPDYENSDHQDIIDHPHAHAKGDEDSENAQTGAYIHSHPHDHKRGKPSHDTGRHESRFHENDNGSESEDGDNVKEASSGPASAPGLNLAVATPSPRVTEGTKAELTSAARNKLPKQKFAYVDSSGEGHLPIHDASHVRNALARFNQTHFDSAAAKSGAMRKIRSAARKYGVEASADSKEWGAPIGLLLTKQADGRLRWFARYSNAWQDRDGEIATEAGHKEYIEWAYGNKTFPQLWLWHTPGTRIGEADWLEFSDGFAHASGLIDQGKEAAAQQLASQKELGVSHGFVSVQSGKDIHRYRTFEISVLPLKRAAVWTTDFNVIGKEAEAVAFTKDKREFLVGVIGEEAVKQLEAGTEKAAASLKQLGVAYKDSQVVAAATAAQASASELEALKVQLKEATDALSMLRTQVVSMQKSDDEKVEDHFLSRLAGAFNGGVRPTAQKGNELSAADAAKIIEQAATGTDAARTKEVRTKDALPDELLRSFGIAITGAAAAAGAGVGAPAIGAVSVNGAAGM